jgi:hypothetical protein
MTKSGSPFSKTRSRRRIPVVRFRRKGLASPAELLILALSLVSSGCHHDAGPITGPSIYSISGTVEVGRDHVGYPAPVSLLRDGIVVATVEADEFGRFSFSGLPSGPVVVRATLAPYAPATAQVTLPPSSSDVHLRLVNLSD